MKMEIKNDGPTMKKQRYNRAIEYMRILHFNIRRFSKNTVFRSLCQACRPSLTKPPRKPSKTDVTEMVILTTLKNCYFTRSEEINLMVIEEACRKMSTAFPASLIQITMTSLIDLLQMKLLRAWFRT